MEHPVNIHYIVLQKHNLNFSVPREIYPSTSGQTIKYGQAQRHFFCFAKTHYDEKNKYNIL